MKKIIGVSLALLALASCAGPKIENPEDAIQKNQTALIEKIEKLQTVTPDIGTSKGTVSIDIDAKEGTFKSEINYDFKANNTTQEAAGNISFNIDANAKQSGLLPVDSLSGNIDIDLVSLKNKIIFKLNTLDIAKADENPQLAMVTGMVAPFLNKWYFIELPNYTDGTIALNDDLLQLQKDLIQLAKKYPLLSYVSTNENKDFYDYEVKISGKNTIDFYADYLALTPTASGSEVKLSDEDIDNIKKSVEEFNTQIKTNIKINKKDLEYFVLTFTQKDGSIVIENTQSAFNLTLVDTLEKITANYTGIKTGNGINGKISVSQETKNLIDGDFNILFDDNTSNVTLDVLAKDEDTDEELKIKVEVNNTTTTEDVVIEEPTDTKDFQEVLGQIFSSSIVPQAEITEEGNISNEVFETEIDLK